MPSNDKLHSFLTLNRKRPSQNLLIEKEHVLSLIQLLIFFCHGCSQLIPLSMCSCICTCQLTNNPRVLYVRLRLYEYYLFGKRACHMPGGRHGSKLWVLLCLTAKSQDLADCLACALVPTIFLALKSIVLHQPPPRRL